MFKLAEESSGLGELIRDNGTLRQVHYQISRFQGVMEGSGLPVPGLFRIEGQIDTESAREFADSLDIPMILKLADGRSLAVTLVDRNGRLLSEGHGPLRCMCC